MPYPGPLRGRVKLRLVCDLTLDAVSETELASRYGVSQQAVSKFRGAHSGEIEAARLDIENEFAELWSASKANRIAELQDDVERIAALGFFVAAIFVLFSLGVPTRRVRLDRLR